MKSKATVGILVVCGFFLVTLGYGAFPGSQTKTVADGVYTSAQADRGMQVLENFGCRNCHGTQLEGGPEEEPPLLGEQFVGLWSGRKLDELAEKITMMPADRAPQDQVRPAAAVDVVAYILRLNGYPEGKAELPSDPAVLKLIEIVAP